MSHTSPASYLVWAVLSTLLGMFLVFHLWNFDRFKCLRWNNGPYSGAFKRIMTYSYLVSVPLIMAYSIGFAILKYNEGFQFIPGMGIIPTPYPLWPQSSQNLIFPFYLLFSIGWSLEMITHLEELCFWLFLVNAGSAQQDWFRSLYFKTWVVGSIIAVAYMPLVTIFTRSDVLKCEAFTFLAGSLGSLSLTLWFLPILWTFPSFLANLKKQGVDINTIVRLTKFHELNTLRVCFRFLFTLPFVALGIDGVRPHQHVNESMFWTDVLAMSAGFGCVLSSGITLVIFFPRSIESEIAAKDATKDRKLATTQNSRSMFQTQQSAGGIMSQDRQSASGDYYLDAAGAKAPMSMADTSITPISPNTKGWARKWEDEEDRLTKTGVDWDEQRDSVSPSLPPRYTNAPQKSFYNTAAAAPAPSASTLHPPKVNTRGGAVDDGGLHRGASVQSTDSMLRPNRKANDGGDVEMGGIGLNSGLTADNLSRHNQRLAKVNPVLHNFKSPLDIQHLGDTDSPSPRFTWRR